MNTTAINDVQDGGRSFRGSRIKRGLMVAAGAAALASGALAFSAAPAFAATPTSVGVHTERVAFCPIPHSTEIGCSLAMARVSVSPAATSTTSTTGTVALQGDQSTFFSAPTCYYDPSEPYCGN